MNKFLCNFKDICVAFGRVGKGGTNITRAVMFSKISWDLDAANWHLVCRNLHILRLNFHIYRIYACVNKYHVCHNFSRIESDEIDSFVPQTRNSERCILDSEEKARWLWDRLKPFIPQTWLVLVL